MNFEPGEVERIAPQRANAPRITRPIRRIGDLTAGISLPRALKRSPTTNAIAHRNATVRKMPVTDMNIYPQEVYVDSEHTLLRSGWRIGRGKAVGKMDGITLAPGRFLFSLQAWLPRRKPAETPLSVDPSTEVA